MSTNLVPKAQPVQEPARWEFRWTNPGNRKNVDADELAWKLVEPRWNGTVSQKAEELRSYLHEGKPTYEVRALYAAPVQPTPTEEQKPLDYCTDPDNCKRCKTHPAHRGGMYHAGIGKHPWETSQPETSSATFGAMLFAFVRTSLVDPSEAQLHQLDRIIEFYGESKFASQLKLLAHQARTPHINRTAGRLVFSGQGVRANEGITTPEAPHFPETAQAIDRLNSIEQMQGGTNGLTIQLRADIERMNAAWNADHAKLCLRRQP